MKHESGFSNEVIEARENALNKDFDTIKSKVSTSPLKSGGASFKTNVLIQESPSKLVYKPSIGAAIFGFIFLAIGLGVLFFNIIPLFKSNFDVTTVNWGLIIFGLIFSIAGGSLFYSLYMPTVFDKHLGLYYKSYGFRLHRSQRQSKDHFIKLKSIIAIQIIGEHIKSDDSSYNSFELNLVLENNTRKNVIDHGDLKSIIIDAETLSDFLNVPIWHAKSGLN